MISRRLQALAQWADASSFADIGCDHGYLAIEILQRHPDAHGFACDLNEKPLESARKNIESQGLSKQIETRLGHGFKALHPEDRIELAILAGMGASTIIEILEAGQPQCRLLLSPHKDVQALREYLQQNGYRIERERMVFDGHFYPILLAEPGQMKLEPDEIRLGYQVMEDEDYKAFLTWEKEKWQNRLENLPPDKRKEMETYLQWINKRLKHNL